MAYEKTTDIDNMERKRLLNRNTSADGSTMFEDSDVEAPPSSANHLLRNRDARYHPSSHATTTSNFAAHVKSLFHSQQSIKLLVLIVLSLQNSLFTVLRRYSQGIRKEEYSKYEVLMMGELIKLGFSAYMIRRALLEAPSSRETEPNDARSLSGLDRLLVQRLLYLLRHSGKMMGLALIYGIMNILSFVALRNIGAGMFTIFAQCKILTTAAFSALILQRRYSWTQWRALLALSLGVLLFSEPIWNKANALVVADAEAYLVAIGVLAVLIEVTLSGFASIYFEKVIKLDPLPLTIWERNFQLALVRCC
jgi:solute carrier family 35 (UDP-sugar transporter), member A1/2/3